MCVCLVVARGKVPMGGVEKGACLWHVRLQVHEAAGVVHCKDWAGEQQGARGGTYIQEQDTMQARASTTEHTMACGACWEPPPRSPPVRT